MAPSSAPTVGVAWPAEHPGEENLVLLDSTTHPGMPG